MDRSLVITALFWGAAVIAIYGQIRVLLSALAGRTPPSSSNRLARAREATWIVLPAVVLTLTLVLTYNAIKHAQPSPATSAGTNVSSSARAT